MSRAGAARRPGAPSPGRRADERIDARQLVAFVRLLLGQSLRRGRDASSGAKGFPLLQVAIATSLMGAMTIPYAWRVTDLASYAILVFLVSFVTVVLNVLPETHETRQRNIDVLQARPIPLRTAGIARALLLAAMAGVLTGAFGVVALSPGLWFFRASPARVGGLWLALVLSAFAAVGAWSTLLLVVLRWARIEIVRRTGQMLFLIFVTGFSVTSTGMLGFGLGTGWRLDAGAVPVLEWLPSTWFARLALPADGPAVWTQRIAAGVVVAGVLGSCLSQRLHRGYQAAVERVWSRGTAPVAPPLAVRVVTSIARLPLLGPRLLPGPAHGVAVAVMISAAREEVARLRILGMQGLALVFFLYGLVGGERFALHMVGYCLFAVALDSLMSARQSRSAEAGWAFVTAPVDAHHVLRGIEAAVLWRSAVLPLFLLAVLAVVRLSLPSAALVTLGAAAVVVDLLALDLVISPTWPLSEDIKVTQSPLGLVLAFFVSLAASGTAWVVIGISEIWPWVGIALGGAALVVLAGVGVGLRFWATHRLRQAATPAS
jgi:hypothetical protein